MRDCWCEAGLRIRSAAEEESSGTGSSVEGSAQSAVCREEAYSTSFWVEAVGDCLTVASCQDGSSGSRSVCLVRTSRRTTSLRFFFGSRQV